MTIRESVRQGFYYARTCRSLWLFGFLVAIASSGGSSGGAGNSNADGGGIDLLPFTGIPNIRILIAALVALAIVGVVVALVVRFLSEGALIEGVVHARRGGRLGVGEALKLGWAHWAVLLRIALCYVGAILVALAALIIPVALAYRGLGSAGALALGVPALITAVPVFVTLHIVQAFASRIAVIENRHALDAIGKARLFLHGRLGLGLRLVVANLIGTIGFALAGIAAIVPLVLLCVALLTVVQLPLAILAAGVLLAPLGFVVFAMLGTYRSAIWTLGYLAEVDA
jgi:hypothetical protein